MGDEEPTKIDHPKILEDLNICSGKSRKVREFYFVRAVGTLQCYMVNHGTRHCDWLSAKKSWDTLQLPSCRKTSFCNCLVLSTCLGLELRAVQKIMIKSTYFS